MSAISATLLSLCRMPAFREGYFIQAPGYQMKVDSLAWRLFHDLAEPRQALNIAEQVRGATAAQLHPAFIDTLAQVYRAACRQTEARQLLVEATAQHPEQAILHYQFGVTLAALVDPYTAKRSLLRALELGFTGQDAQEAQTPLATP